ncbi:hypothetical protein ABE438_18770 [Bosea sp. TWI1241]|jgi:glucose/arabinose dehydrogenase|uniref:hypothetical protein n=1 Tax=Bosea sp. TWI1241 TaxID=3148904 RepID=UPI003208F340
MLRMPAAAALVLLLAAPAALAQAPAPQQPPAAKPAAPDRPAPAAEKPAKMEKPASPEVATCKAGAMAAITAREPEIKDIFIDEDGLTIAVAETKVEDTPVTRIIMGEAYLQTDRSDKPRRFLCLLGEKGKVLLTFFTQR